MGSMEGNEQMSVSSDRLAAIAADAMNITVNEVRNMSEDDLVRLIRSLAGSVNVQSDGPDEEESPSAID